jgi:hypothetical protein
LSTAHGRAEFPAGQRSHEFSGKIGWPRLQNLKTLQIPARVKFAFYDNARARQPDRKIGADSLRPGKSACAWMTAWVGVRELHHYRAQVCIDVDGVVISRKLAIEIKSAAGTGSGDDGDRRPGISFDR